MALAVLIPTLQKTRPPVQRARGGWSQGGGPAGCDPGHRRPQQRPPPPRSAARRGA